MRNIVNSRLAEDTIVLKLFMIDVDQPFIQYNFRQFNSTDLSRPSCSTGAKCLFSTNIPVLASQRQVIYHFRRRRSRYYQLPSPLVGTFLSSLPWFWIQTKIFAHRLITSSPVLDLRISLLGFSPVRWVRCIQSRKVWNKQTSHISSWCTWYTSSLAPPRCLV